MRPAVGMVWRWCHEQSQREGIPFRHVLFVVRVEMARQALLAPDGSPDSKAWWSLWAATGEIAR